MRLRRFCGIAVLLALYATAANALAIEDDPAIIDPPFAARLQRETISAEWLARQISAAAERSQLRISSKTLRLAQRVSGE